MQKIIIIALAALAFSCQSAGIPADSEVVAGNSRAAGQLEATVASLDRTVADSRERIGRVLLTGRSIEDGIVRLEYLFECYEREVVLLQLEVDAIRRQAEEGL